MYPVELGSARLRLREFRVEDATAMWRYASAQEPMFFPPGTVSSEEETAAWVGRMLEHARSADRRQYRLAVEPAGGAELIGTVRLHDDVPYDRQGSLGYALWHEHWGRGLATEAASMMMDFGFDRLGLHRIEATVEPGNTRSIRVLEKLGMRIEGFMKERFRVEDGWRDSLLYAITEDEWRARRAGRTAPDAT